MPKTLPALWRCSAWPAPWGATRPMWASPPGLRCSPSCWPACAPNPCAPVLAGWAPCWEWGVLGGILYFGVVKLEQLHYGTTMEDYCGADQISAGKSLSLLVPLPAARLQRLFPLLPHEDRPHRRGPLDAAGGQRPLCGAVAAAGAAAPSRPPGAAGSVGVLLPLAFNVIDVIATDVRVDRLMSYPMQLLLPFCFALWTLPETKTLRRTRRAAATLLMTAVCWLFALSANATYARWSSPTTMWAPHRRHPRPGAGRPRLHRRHQTAQWPASPTKAGSRRPTGCTGTASTSGRRCSGAAPTASWTAGPPTSTTTTASIPTASRWRSTEHRGQPGIRRHAGLACPGQHRPLRRYPGGKTPGEPAPINAKRTAFAKGCAFFAVLRYLVLLGGPAAHPQPVRPPCGPAWRLPPSSLPGRSSAP